MNDTPTGQVWIEDFDRGVIVTMGGQILDWSLDGNDQSNYIIPLANFSNLTSADMPVDLNGISAPGVPITFNNPSGIYEDHVLPSIEVSRNDEFSVALNRWTPCTLAYRAPATGAVAKQVTLPSGTVVDGYDKYETQQSAWPYDVIYTINIKAKYRRVAQEILSKIVRIYQPYSLINVIDSLSETRTYSAYNEGFVDTSEILAIDDRIISWSLTLRVEAEIDMNDPVEHKAVFQLPEINFIQK